MFIDLRIDKFTLVCLQPLERTFFVGSHQPAVAGDVGRQNGREPPLHPLAGQGSTPKRSETISSRRSKAYLVSSRPACRRFGGKGQGLTRVGGPLVARFGRGVLTRVWLLMLRVVGCLPMTDDAARLRRQASD